MRGMVFFLLVIIAADFVALDGPMRKELQASLSSTIATLSRELRIFR